MSHWSSSNGSFFKQKMNLIQSPNTLDSTYLESRNSSSYSRIVRRSQGHTLNDQQMNFICEFLHWIETGMERSAFLEGFAGTGKTYALKYAVAAAQHLGLVNREIHLAAPTHQAAGVLRKSLEGVKFKSCGTLHSLLSMAPQVTRFLEQDDTKLRHLLALENPSLGEQQQINYLRIKEDKANRRIQDFYPVGGLDHLASARLIVIDEGRMVNSYMFGLIQDFLDEASHVDPELQVLWLGDRRQLPPIGEKMGLVETLPAFTKLTQIERYTGATLKYCEMIENEPESGLSTLHHRCGEDEHFMVLPSYEILNPEAIQNALATKKIRFVSATNSRVRELNNQIRALQTGSVEYAPGDEILTTSAISHTYGPNGIKCNDRQGGLELGTSVLVTLSDPFKIGDSILFGGLKQSGRIRLKEEQLTYTVNGYTFERQLFRYTNPGSPFSTADRALCLINPKQYEKWFIECRRLERRASCMNVGKSNKKELGQEGKQAQEIWDEYGLKNWKKRKDGSPFSLEEYKNLKKKLWTEYYELLGFGDHASWAYCSTVHRLQGATVDVVIVDALDILKPRSRWQKEGDDGSWDIRALLYTSATRGSEQCIFME